MSGETFAYRDLQDIKNLQTVEEFLEATREDTTSD